MDELEIISETLTRNTEAPKKEKSDETSSRPKVSETQVEPAGDDKRPSPDSGKGDSGHATPSKQFHEFQYRKTPFIPDYFFKPFKEIFGVDSPFEPSSQGSSQVPTANVPPNAERITVPIPTPAQEPSAEASSNASQSTTRIEGPNDQDIQDIINFVANPRNPCSSGPPDPPVTTVADPSGSQQSRPSNNVPQPIAPAVGYGSTSGQTSRAPLPQTGMGQTPARYTVLPPVTVLQRQPATQNVPGTTHPSIVPAIPAHPVTTVGVIAPIGASARVSAPSPVVNSTINQQISTGSLSSASSSSVPTHQLTSTTFSTVPQNVIVSESARSSPLQPYEFLCHACKQRFVSNEKKTLELTLLDHYSDKHLAYYPYQCTVCRSQHCAKFGMADHPNNTPRHAKFTSVQKASDHVKIVHDNQHIRIELQRDAEKERKLTQMHRASIIAINGGPQISSQIRQQPPDRNSPLQPSRNSSSPQVWYKCQCGFMTLDESSVKGHVAKIHLKAPLLTCPLCVNVYSYFEAGPVLEHMRTAHPCSSLRPVGHPMREAELQRLMGTIVSKVVLTPQPIQPGTLVKLPNTAKGQPVYGHVVKDTPSSSPQQTEAGNTGGNTEEDIVVLKHKQPAQEKSKHPDGTTTENCNLTQQNQTNTQNAQIRCTNPFADQSNPPSLPPHPPPDLSFQQSRSHPNLSAPISTSNGILPVPSTGAPNNAYAQRFPIYRNMVPNPGPSSNGVSGQFHPTNPRHHLQTQTGVRTSWFPMRLQRPPNADNSSGAQSRQSIPNWIGKCQMCNQIVNPIHHRLHAVTKHLGRHLIFCPLCPHSAPYNQGGIRTHIKTCHPEVAYQAQTMKIIDKRAESEEEINLLTAKCFPPNLIPTQTMYASPAATTATPPTTTSDGSDQHGPQPSTREDGRLALADVFSGGVHQVNAGATTSGLPSPIPEQSPNKPSLECALCGKIIVYDQGSHSLRLHVLNHIGRNLVRCPHCSFSALNLVGNVKRHIEQCHPGQHLEVIDDRHKYQKEYNVMRRKCFKKDALGRYIRHYDPRERGGSLLDGILPSLGETSNSRDGGAKRQKRISDEDLAWNMALCPESPDTDSDTEAPEFGPAAHQKKQPPPPSPKEKTNPEAEGVEDRGEEGDAAEPEPPPTHPFQCGDCPRRFIDIQVALLHGISCPNNTKGRSGKSNVVWDTRTEVNIVKLEPTDEEEKEIKLEVWNPPDDVS